MNNFGVIYLLFATFRSESGVCAYVCLPVYLFCLSFCVFVYLYDEESLRISGFYDCKKSRVRKEILLAFSYYCAASCLDISDIDTLCVADKPKDGRTNGGTDKLYYSDAIVHLKKR